MLDKYESQTNNDDSQYSQSQSILQETVPPSRQISNNRSDNFASGQAKSMVNGKNRRQSTGIAKTRFSAIELSDDSDDDNDVLPVSVRTDTSRANNVGESITGTSTNNVNSDSGLGVIQVECPLCGDFYPSYIIEVHASSCYL
jgi:hypothetical protein